MNQDTLLERASGCAKGHEDLQLRRYGKQCILVIKAECQHLQGTPLFDIAEALLIKKQIRPGTCW